MVKAARTNSVIDRIEAAPDWKSLFGSDHSKYIFIHRDLQIGCHPDQFAADPVMQKRAEAAFQQLEQMYGQAIGKPRSATPLKVGDYIVEGTFSRGDLCDLYRVKSTIDKVTDNGLLKLVRSAKDNDLMEAEAFTLAHLHEPKDDTSITFQRFIPKLMGSVKADGRCGNILSYSDGYIPLADFNKLWPELDMRHLVWMGNRALTALSYIHHRGVVHGAVLPCHMLYQPANHEFKLVDWCYSVKLGGGKHIPAIVSKYKWLYPAEVMRKLPPTPATDIAMLFKSLGTLRTEWPLQFKAISDWATAGSHNARPQSTDELCSRWMETAKKVYGPRKFIPLEMPTNH